MAKIPLRVYNHEIEQLIEKHQTQEAIAHCKQILKFYPKHIDTYRLLGKAFLESQRYGEASDILQRVLSVVPDDFISQLGMSLIREDEGNLDGAIYHMERAFEVQPANAAIQEELRRLYGNRDGIQPPKIRLTRGALVRMYGKGELFTQAIAEANSALNDDPQRVDLQVLLARLYYQSGQTVKATEVSSKLVDQLPYCYEANRILAEVLPGTSRPEEARVYQERLRALDPYLAFVSDAQPTSNAVPDSAVLVEQLEYDPDQDEAAQPGWAQQVGVAWTDTPVTEEKPDWMSSEPAGEETLPAAATAAGEDIAEKAADLPDWMVAAGWQPSTGEEVETHLTEDTAEDLAAPGSLPDWLQEMAPDLSQQTEAAAEETEEDAQWLDQMLGAAPAEAEPPVDELSAAKMEEIPDWLQETGAAETTVPAADTGVVPDWLQNISAGESAEQAFPGTETALPDWLAMESGEAPQAEAQAAAQDWIAEETADATEAEMPDWLKAIAVESEPSNEAIEAVTSEVEIPAVPEEIIEPTPEAELPSGEEQPLAPPEDMDAALAWLESLAARQGADEETLITQPEQRGAEMPDWLQKEAESVAQVDQPTTEQPFAAVEEVSMPEQPAAEVEESPAVSEAAVPEWLQEQPAPAAEETAVPEWLQEQPEQAVEESPAAAETSVPEWLQEQPQVEEPAEETKLPEWLQEIAGETPDAVSTGDTEGELPEWLDIPASEAVESAEQAVEGVDLPEWLEEEAATEPVAETRLEEAVILEEVAPAAPELEPAASVEEPPAAAEASLPIPGAGEDIDAALAWLESLAARQGADEETLITRPEDRREAPPEWVQQAEETPTEAVGETLEPAEQMETEPESSVAVAPEIAEMEAEVMETAEAAAEAAPVEDQEATVVEAVQEQAGEDITLPEGLTEIAPAVEEYVEHLEEAAATEVAELASMEAQPAVASEWVAEEPPAEEKTQPVRVAAPEMTEGVVGLEEEEAEEGELPDWLKDLSSYSTDLTDEEEEETITAEWLSHAELAGMRTAETPPAITDETPVAEALEAPVAEMPEIPSAMAPEVPEAEAVEAPAAEALEAPAELPTQPVAVEPPASGPAGERLQQAQTALEKGNIPAALTEYNRFIQNGEQLEETIHDLRDALYRYPMDTDLWQTLGDAYMRGNRIQEALDAYTKAEELLR